MSLDLVILAAGRSTRYGAPKMLAPIGPAGECLSDYAVFDALGAGVSRLIYVINRAHRLAFEAHHGTHLPRGLPVEYVIQDVDDLPRGLSAPAGRDKPWGTGHALLSAAARATRPFMMINADDFYGREAFARLARHLRETAGARPPRFALVGYRLSDTLSGAGGVSRALCRVDRDGRLLRVAEHLEVRRSDGRIGGRRAVSGEPRTYRGDEPVSMNIWGFTPDVFALLEAEFRQFLGDPPAAGEPEFLIGAAVQRMITGAAARVDVLPGGARWFGITHPEDSAPAARAIAALVREGRYPAPLFAGSARNTAGSASLGPARQ